MTQEEKNLLLKDICSRLPYGVKAYVKNWSNLERRWIEGIYTVRAVYPSLNNIVVSSELGSVEVILGYSDYFIKPYLFPMSSMTEEQKKEYNLLRDFVPTYHYEYGDIVEDIELCDNWGSIDYLIANHFDYRELIPKGLALNASGLNIY